MKLLNRLERKFGDFAIPNLTIYLIALQAFSWILLQAHPDFVQKLVLTHDGLMAGEVWRLLTILLIPPGTNLLFLAIVLYFFFMIGNDAGSAMGNVSIQLLHSDRIPRDDAGGVDPGSDRFRVLPDRINLLAFAWLFPELPDPAFFCSARENEMARAGGVDRVSGSRSSPEDGRSKPRWRRGL